MRSWLCSLPGFNTAYVKDIRQLCGGVRIQRSTGTVAAATGEFIGCEFGEGDPFVRLAPGLGMRI